MSEVATRRRRRRLRAWGGAAAVLAVLGVAAAATVGLGGKAPAGPAASSRQLHTVRVTRGPLVDYVTVSGTVSYGESVALRCLASGTVTRLPPVGSVVTRGQDLLRVDEHPVVLLYGPLPMYRPLAEHTTGPDVAQFEANLWALGYRGFTVDRSYSAATATAVKHWQRDLGVAETGRVGQDQVIYAAGPARVAGHLVRVGNAAAADVLTVTGTTRSVRSAVDPDKAGWAVPGARVTVMLPGGRSTLGTVTAAGDPAATAAAAGGVGQGDAGQGDAGGAGATGGGAAGGDSASVQVLVRVPDQRALASVGPGQVDLRYIAAQRPDVLSVPVDALLALAEGGYGVEVDDHGSSRIITVRTGLFAAGRVEVSGAGLAAGMTVRVPE
jgi:peptidoglycan hydrolase-like protein with peptidoglycan-binding domain